ncbi:serine-rich adhesin for platelets [Zeugodacus cucurbitae]|uniref:serine-rich adhesin for platelets n=1 Tax=Zeugodacus cucurbitae TaxID=28588 RepID=UPI0023D916D3|nr:serine-rich adhesin for platelets [Zeugodacus cucurbitae]
MPICNKPAQALSQKKNATEFDDYASEAAKMKRTREQAYFNSYNFDAIQPYDPKDFEEQGVVHKVGAAAAIAATHTSATITATKVPSVVGGGSNHSQHQQQQQLQQKPHNTLKTIYRGASSIASSTQSTRSSFQHSSSSGRSSQHSLRSSDVDDDTGFTRRPQHTGELTYTYMQRFGVRLVRSRNASPSSAADVDVKHTGSLEGGNGGGAIMQAEELAPVHGKKSSATEISESGSFLLPRAMLKYQSVGNANSMPLAVNSSGRADKLLQNGHNHHQQSGNNESNYNNNNSNNNNNHNNSASYNKYNNNNSSGETMMMMTTNAISNKHSNSSSSSSNNNSSNSLSSNKSNATANIANTKTINNSNSNSNGSSSSSAITNTNSHHIATKNRLNYANSNDGYASLLVASDVQSTAPFRVVTAAKTPTTAIATAVAAKAKATAANSAPGAAVRVKKQSTSSTITTTTTSSSVSAAEHNAAIAAATAAVASTPSTRGNGKVSQTSKSGDTKSAQSGSVERRGRTSSHQSHYSTDKSGSSGYYSSNVCSTYSLDEHIYCEPVIDILDVSKTSKQTNTKAIANSSVDTNNKSNPAATEMSSKSGVGGGGGATKRCYGRRSVPAVTSRNGESGIAGCSELDGEDDCDGDAEDESGAAAVTRRGNSKSGRKSQAVAETTFGAEKIPASLQFLLQRQTSDEYATSQHFSENLRILETSIENLDRHLKNFPSLSSHEHIAAFVQAHHHHHHHHLAYMQSPSVETGDKQAVRVPPHVAQQQHQLPTIMEGYDPANQPRRSWPDDMVDDSLLDIDLDSFLLVNERKAGGIGKSARAKSSMHAAVGGIDNPTFLTEEQEEENNYKCAKYINSCPDDAYHVESDIVAGTGTVSEKSVSVADHYMKRYEDQLHFQSTRELLEDVRDKIRLLSQASGNTSRSGSAQTHSPDMSLSVTAPTEQLPRELEGMIKTLKNELENYLDRMNQHSELEIRQLCSGLVRNHNIVKMKKAFERRRSTHSLGTIESDYGYVGNYEAICDGVPSSIREQIVSIRCASDPNFKMKRKSLTEVFPVADCYAESSEKLQTPAVQSAQQQQQRPSLPRRDRVEQRQRELDQNVITLHVPTTQLQRNLSFQQPILNKLDAKSLQAPPTDAELSGKGSNANGAGAVGGNGNGSGAESGESGDKDSILEWHRKKPSIWEMYYGTNRMNQSLLGKRNGMVTNNNNQVPMSYPSSRPESDFTLDLPRAEQLRIKMEKEKKFRQRCRYITTFLSLVFFLLTVMVVSLVLTRGKRMFGSMI